MEIRYRGLKTVDEARLRNFMSVQAGQPYRAEALDKDVKSLYESGLVDDVRFFAEPAGNGVRLIAEVSTRPQFNGVGFVGNTVFSDKKLAKESGLKSGGVLSDAEILAARRKIEKYYQDSGYPDVSITHRLQPSGQGGSADLIFVINEGSKNEIRHIRFEGNHAFTDHELRRQMKVKTKGIFSFLTKSGRFETGQLDTDVDAILDFYRSKGYLRASCPGVRRIQVSGGRVDIVIPISEGEKYTVGGVGFSHLTVFKPEELYPALTLNTNDAYSSKKMRADMTMIRKYYGSRGYADATVSPDIRDAGPNRVTIIYRITEGGRFRVGQVNIEGNTKTKDKVIRREVPLKPNQNFNSVDLDTTRTRLQNLRYFSDVQVTGVPGKEGYRDVNVLVEEQKTGSFGVGVGFNSIESLVGFLNIEQSNFDIAHPWNFTGGGQRAAFTARVGEKTSDLSLSLTEPWFMDRKLALGGELFYHLASYYSTYYEQRNVGADVFLRRPLGEKGAIKLDYRLEQVSINLESVPAGSEYYAEAGTFLRSAVGLSYDYDTRDSNTEPREGEKIHAGVTLAGTVLGGDVNDVNIDLRAQKYWNLWADTIFSINGELACVDSTNGQNVPLFERMFLGGGHTLRGFKFHDVSDNRDPVTQDAMGGNSLGFLSFEYTAPVIDMVRVATFYDMGFVHTQSWNLSPDGFYSDVGVGIRVKLPISPMPLALDYGIPLSSPNQEANKGGQFNFYLNYEY